MATQASIVNDALELIGSQAQVTGTLPNFDGSPAGLAAGVLYTPALQLLLREMDPDFARTIAGLGAQANATLLPFTSWISEFAYPATCLRLRQLKPNPGSYDINDPQPVRGEVAFDPLSSGGPAKVVLTTLAGGYAVFTTSTVTEAQFDACFTEAFSRRLASPLAMALAGRPDFARELLEESERYAQIAELSEELQ